MGLSFMHVCVAQHNSSVWHSVGCKSKVHEYNNQVYQQFPHINDHTWSLLRLQMSYAGDGKTEFLTS